MFKRKFPWTAVTVSFVTGAFVGAATALLFAPTTGKKLQKQLRNVVDEQVGTIETLVKKMVA